MPKQTIAIITGGKSPEHEVSLISAFNIAEAVDKSKFKTQIIGVSKNGVWYEIPLEEYSAACKIGSKESHKELVLQPFRNPAILYKDNLNQGISADVIFPIIHGTNGEDGTLQGVLTHLGIPYVGPNTLGSAIGMDKDVTKKLAELAGVKVVPSAIAYKGADIPYDRIIDELGLPLFIKPVNMGSAVGVEKVELASELESALNRAFEFDRKVLIEKAIVGREVETAILGNRILKVTGVGEIVIENDFYTYENKYENDKAKVVIPAQNLSAKSVKLIQEMALKTYRAAELSGMSRVDFFYVSDDEIYLNEVNTLPGFTNISMYPKLWAESGLSFTDLITELVGLAIEEA